MSQSKSIFVTLLRTFLLIIGIVVAKPSFATMNITSINAGKISVSFKLNNTSASYAKLVVSDGFTSSFPTTYNLTLPNTYSPGIWTLTLNACDGRTGACTLDTTLYATVLADPAPTLAPQNLTGSYVLQWPSVQYADKYEVCEHINSDNASCGVLQTTTNLSANFTGKNTGTYSYQVRAGKTTDRSNWSAAKQIIVSRAPGSPASVTATKNASGDISVTWPAVSGAATYVVERRRDAELWESTGTITGTTVNQVGLPVGGYTYRVSACSSYAGLNSCSGWAQSAVVNILLSGEFNFDANAPADFLYSLLNMAGVPQLANATLVAATSGKESVTNGSVSYKIPVSTPRVINSLTPNISLNYTSSNQRGLLGVGWNVGGLSSIYRCHKNFANEGALAELGNPHFTKADRLCLDGKKLELASTAAAETVSDDAYWASNAEYRTELDTFNKIVAQGSSQNGGHGGFIVYRKNGEIARYGLQTNNQASRLIVPGGPQSGAIKVWALDHVEDRYQNFYDIFYAQSPGGEFQPANIYWSNNSSLVFEYSNRDAALGSLRPDIPTTFDAGAQFKTTKLLKGISTYVNAAGSSSPTSGTPLKHYQIAYKRSLTTDRYLVDTVRECGFSSSGSEECAKALIFDWHLGESGFASSPTTLSTCSGRQLNYMKSADINNDGYVDLMYYKVPTNIIAPEERRPWSYALGTAAGCFAEPVDLGWESLIPIRLTTGFGLIGATCVYDTVTKSESCTFASQGFTLPNSIAGGKAPRVVDFNSDGLDDFYYGGKIYLQNLTGGFQSVSSNVISALNEFDDVFIDVNSDGKKDRIFVTKGNRADGSPGTQYYRSTSSTQDGINYSYLNGLGPASQPTNWVENGLYAPAIAFPVSAFGTYIDFNGDGLKDLIYNTGTSNTAPFGHWGLKMNDGVSAFTLPYNPSEDTGLLDPANGKSFYAFALDCDKDGLEDVVYQTGECFLSTSNNGVTRLKPNGYIFTGHENNVYENVYSGEFASIFKGDINNDGIVDFFNYQAKQQQPDLLKSVTNGFGARVEFEYSPLTADINNGVALYTPDPTPVNYPFAPVQRSMQVVRRMGVSDGLGGIANIFYNYQGGKTDLRGRGFAGFSQITVTNPVKKLVETTTYRQDFPFTGMPLTKKLAATDGNLISYTNNAYGSATGNARHIYLTSTITRQYGLTTTDLNASISAVATRNFNNAYGSLEVQYVDFGKTAALSSTTTVSDIQKRIIRDPEYAYDDPSQWLIGFVSDYYLDQYSGDYNEAINSYSSFTPQTGTLDILERIDYSDGNPTLTTGYHRLANGVIDNTSSSAIEINGGNTPARSLAMSDFVEGQFPRVITNAKGQNSRFIYHSKWGVASTETDPNGLVTSHEFDALGRPTAEVDATGNRTEQLAYYCDAAPVTCPTNAAFLIATRVTNPAAPTQLGAPLVIHYFDALQRELRQETYAIDGSRIRIDRQYYGDGSLARVSNPFIGASANYWTQYNSYDVMGRPTLVTQPDGGTQQTRYEQASGQLKSTQTLNIVSPISGSSPNQQTKVTYFNAVGLVSATLDANLTPTAYEYDPQGNLVSSQVNNNPATKLVNQYDTQGRKTLETDPNTGSIRFEYNGFGELRRQTWRPNLSDSKSITWDYDVLGRQISRVDKAVDNTSESYAWIWDTQKIGLLTSQTGPAFSESYGYNALSQTQSQTTTIEGNSRTFGFGYDAFGRSTYTTYPNSLKMDNQYQANGYLARVRDITTSSTPKVLWAIGGQLDEQGNSRNVLTGNGVVSQRVYDVNSGRLKTIKSGSLRFSSFGNLYGDVQNLGYSFDSEGNLVQRTSNRTDTSGNTAEYLTETFKYDALNRLTHSSTSFGLPASREMDYGYDELGNLKSRTDIGTLTYDRARNAGPHGVTAAAGKLYGYDLYGNMTSRAGEAIQYNVFNKPTRIGSNTFLYGPGHQLVREINNGITSYLFGNNYREDIQNGVKTEKIELAGVGTIAKTSGVTTITYSHSDVLGSTEALTDKMGNYQTRMSFDPWGKRQLSDWKTGNPGSTFATTLGFTQHEMLDPSGLIHMGGRVYDSNLGRFLSADILVQDPGNSQSFNRYSYVSNNPLRYTDPSGYCSMEWGTNNGVDGNIVFRSPVTLVGDDCFPSSDPFNNPGGMPGPSVMDLMNQSPVVMGMDGLSANGYLNDVGDISAIEDNPLEGAIEAILEDMTGGILFGSTSSIGALHPSPQVSANMRAAKEGPAGKYLVAASVVSMLNPGKAGKTVLGHFPEYKKLADSIGARRFNIPENIWNKMSDTARWTANQKFLDRMILRGDNILLATPLDKVRPGSYFARELEYMGSKGYKPSGDGSLLLKVD